MKKILVGSTNPSKIEYLKSYFSDRNVKFLTLHDLNITDEPSEIGKTPKENAAIKAKFYGQFYDCVICSDSGLYIKEIDFDDPRQPGLHIRSPFGKRLNDDEMIEYYSDLAHSLGGRMSAYYVNGFAVYHQKKVYEYMDTLPDLVDAMCFWIVDKPHEKRQPGWPLDSLSVRKQTNRYYLDETVEYQKNEKEKAILKAGNQRLKDFFLQSCELELSFGLLTDEDKKAICSWKYPQEYALYNLPSYQQMKEHKIGFMNPLTSNNYYAFKKEKQLIGYVNLLEEEQSVFLGIGVHPDKCNQGYGKKILKETIQLSKEKYPDKPIYLEVRTWNQRAIRCYEKVGFKIIGEAFEMTTNIGTGMFYRMML